LSNINGTLFFAADDGVHGTEPWILGPVPSTTSAPAVAHSVTFLAAPEHAFSVAGPHSVSGGAPATLPARSHSFSATPGMGKFPSALAKPPDDEVAHAIPVSAHPRHANRDQGELLAWFFV
jgi:hypothetical protein